MKLPTYEEFASLFLEPEHRLINQQDFYDCHQDIIGDEAPEYLLDSEEYKDLYFEVFMFVTEASYSLQGSFTEVFAAYLGENNFKCIMDDEFTEEGSQFILSYKGKTAQCIESFSDADEPYYVDGMMALTALLYDDGLVLKSPANNGVTDSYEFMLIPLEIWNKGVEQFGLEKLTHIFVNFDEYFNEPYTIN